MKNKIKDVRLSIIDYVIWLIIDVIVSYIVSVVAMFFIIGASISSILYVLSHQYVVLGTIVLSVVLFIPFIYTAYIQFERNYVMRRLMSMKKAIEGNLENSHFMTKREMIDNGYKVLNNFEELKKSEDGILLSLEETRKNLKVIISPEIIHTLVLGTTGSGKTAGYIIPSIKALANTLTKPSFLFTDPKGEINEKTAWYLKEQGYNVLVMDFRHPERSLRWNPLAGAFEKYKRAKSIAEETVFNNGKYFFDGNEYDVDSIEEAEKVSEQRLEDEAFEDIQNIVYSLCPVNTRDPIWDNGARSLIQAVILAMLEDSEDMYSDMDIDKFCFYNVAKICGQTQNDCAELIKYFQYRKKTSLAVQYSGMVLNAPDKQRGSYLSSVAEKLTMFNDRGICNMTSGRSEINVSEMDEKPTAIYLILPDEKVGRHALGSLFIAETYKKLVEKAIANGGKLKRNVYFMMDEFGNMPKIDNVASMFTVGRSRGIIQIPVIQSYSQVVEKYGPEVAKTVFGNCNTEIFIGAKDDETCEKFSKKLGNYSVMTTSVTGVKRAWEHNYSESLKERPLMYPRELTLLNNKKNMGNIIVLNQGYSPTLGKFTPYFKSKLFENKSEAYVGITPRAMDEELVLYDFTARAKNIEKDIQELDRLENEETKEINPQVKEEKIIKKESDVILQKLLVYAQMLERQFNADEQRNLEIIDEMITLFRNDRQISKLNQVLKLKAQYESALESEKNLKEEKNVKD